MVLKSSLEKIFNEIFIKEYRLGSRKTDFDCYSLSDAKQEIGIYDKLRCFYWALVATGAAVMFSGELLYRDAPVIHWAFNLHMLLIRYRYPY
ncbi:hypothetical protein KGM_212985 [Danaus plexippus plexippus]|uniref:Uncharacterized protein n=1 Tax=Danaus plexippus plexippus TaxID=278856 RepID=A0A212FF32_DANPL|nr:hypothetical protein KGM_212985 [Danaus plexippus plexippus]